jgi:hypothetical protein
VSSKAAKGFLTLAVSWQILAGLSGCEIATHNAPQPMEGQLKLASVRSRAFAMTDRQKMLRAAIATLQDLGFIVDRADSNLASVSGTKLNQYLLRWTVTVSAQGAELLVRANARYDVTPVLEAEPYEKFFAALSRALSLAARQVD